MVETQVKLTVSNRSTTTIGQKTLISIDISFQSNVVEHQCKDLIACQKRHLHLSNDYYALKIVRHSASRTK